MDCIKRSLAYFALVLGLMLNSDAYSASVITMTLDDLVTSADNIVVGRCVDIQSRWQGSKIVTDATIDILQQIKGDLKTQLVITTLGGTAIHPRLKTLVNMNVPGSARFNVDDEVLVFSKENSKGNHQIVGLTQGKFDLETDSFTGEIVIPVGQKILTNETTQRDPLDALFSADTGFQSDDTKISVRTIRLNELLGQIEQRLSTR